MTAHLASVSVHLDGVEQETGNGAARLLRQHEQLHDWQVTADMSAHTSAHTSAQHLHVSLYNMESSL